MAVKFAGTSRADFEVKVVNGSFADARETTAARIGPYVAEGFVVRGGTRYAAQFCDPLTEDDIWVTFYSWNTSFADDGFVELYDPGFSESQAVYRFWCDASDNGNGSGFRGNVRVEAWNGSTWVQLARGTSSLASDTLGRWDMHIHRDDTVGTAAVYLNGVLDVEVTGIDTNLTAWTSIERAEFYMAGVLTDQMIISSLIIDSVSTLAAIFVQEVPTGNGTNTDFTGGFGDIDEAGLNNTDFISSETIGDVETFTGSINAIIDSGYDISASVISVYAENISGSNIRLGAAYRSGGVDYSGENKLFAPGVSSRQFAQGVDPNTSAAWTPAGIEAAEFGLEYLAL